MKYLELETFTDFKCIGSTCPFTCCAGGWRIIIDQETDKYYRSVTGDFGDRLANSIKEEKGDRCFTLTEDGRCSFLNKDNLCDIYINLGEEHMCYTCTVYPRYSFIAGDVRFAGVTISCPEVARFMLEHQEPLQIDFAEDKRNVNTGGRVDWQVFNHAIRAYTTAVRIAQDRNFTLNDRLAVLSIFVFQFQSCLDAGKDPSGFIDAFSDHSNLGQIASQAGIFNRDLGSKVAFYSEILSYLGMIGSFQKILPELHELREYMANKGTISINADRLQEAYATLDDREVQIRLEQLIVYTLHRYFMQGFSKKDFYDKFLIGALLFYEISISTVVMYHLRWERLPSFDELVLIVAHTSRVVEHDDGFRDKTIEHFKNKGLTELSYLLKLFS